MCNRNHGIVGLEGTQLMTLRQPSLCWFPPDVLDWELHHLQSAQLRKAVLLQKNAEGRGHFWILRLLPASKDTGEMRLLAKNGQSCRKEGETSSLPPPTIKTISMQTLSLSFHCWCSLSFTVHIWSLLWPGSPSIGEQSFPSPVNSFAKTYQH